jgi:hypothetical protein
LTGTWINLKVNFQRVIRFGKFGVAVNIIDHRCQRMFTADGAPVTDRLDQPAGTFRQWPGGAKGHIFPVDDKGDADRRPGGRCADIPDSGFEANQIAFNQLRPIKGDASHNRIGGFDRTGSRFQLFV